MFQDLAFLPSVKWKGLRLSLRVGATREVLSHRLVLVRPFSVSSFGKWE